MPELIAYTLRPSTQMRLIPAPQKREWMTSTPNSFAQRCLPMLISNAYGWFLLNPAPFRTRWNGLDGSGCIEIEYEGEPPIDRARSHFGSGILTFTIPYLFRTSSGYNLQVRGPTNTPKDGIYALEGIVETDWAHATFTMNWKFTRPGVWVSFERDEPISMIAPLKRGELETFEPSSTPLQSDPDLSNAYHQWSRGRAEFNSGLKSPGSEAMRRGWEKDYFQGKRTDGSRVEEHQTRILLNPFEPYP